MVFPVVRYGCESWTIKKAECWRIDAFELWCWGRLLKVPWTARRSNRSILREISPGCSLEGLMLKLKLQYFGHLMWRADSFEKTLMLERLRAGGEVDDRGWDGWMASLTQWTWVWVNSGSWWWTRRLDVLWFMGSQRVRHDWVTELNWTDWLCICIPNSYVKKPWLHQPFQTCSCDITWHPLRVRTWGWLSDNALWLMLLSLSHRHNSGDIGQLCVLIVYDHWTK